MNIGQNYTFYENSHLLISNNTTPTETDISCCNFARQSPQRISNFNTLIDDRVFKSTQEVNIQLIPAGKVDLYTLLFQTSNILISNFRILTQPSKHSCISSHNEKTLTSLGDLVSEDTNIQREKE